jgi:murein DD-endopeptidase MepM/ murein hydrolase activator NlpD
MMTKPSCLMEWDDLVWHTPPVLRAGVRVAAWIWRWNGDRAGLRPMLGRMASHAALVLVLLLFVVIGSVQFEFIASASEVAEGMAFLEGVTQRVNPAPTVARPYYRSGLRAHIVREAESHTAIPERPRLEIVSYTVQAGDTAEKIAESFGLQPTTLMWSNPSMEKRPDLLKVGQVLTILPIDGVYHTVEMSDTLDSIAEAYDVDVVAIMDCSFNDLPQDGELTVGDKVIVPGGTKPYETRKVTNYGGPVPEDATGSGLFYWPTTGALTQGYWYGHRAIDVGSPVGTAIVASDGGYVSFAGWTDIGYGYLIVLDHANGFQTYYAHLSNIFVSEGEAVYAGQVIGAMGSTGNSTGPHLHYEIRYNGYPTNPLIYLP